MTHLLLLLLGGCASMDKAMVTSDSVGPGGADLDADANQLRIDIIPGESTPFLDSQSWLIGEDEDLGSLAIDILPSVTVRGQLVGYTATPYGAEVPGADETPVDGLVSMFRLGTIAGSSVSTEIEGKFSLQVPPSSGYQFSAIPAEEQSLPFLVEVDTTIDTETDLGIIDLGYGNPVYGRVTADNDEAVLGASVQLQDVISGVVGPRSMSDDNGHFILRAKPGEYSVVVSGMIGQAIPTIHTPIEVLENEGTEVNIAVGSLQTATVYGQLFGPKLTTAQRDVRVRFSSAQLNGSEGSLEIETETDGDGVFSRSLLPGTWSAELIPPFDSKLAPSQVTFTVSDDQSMVNLGEVALPERINFRSVAMDPSGNPVAGVAVNARELGFDGFIRSTTTDADGWFELDLAPHPMALMLVPPGQTLAVTHAMINPVTDRGSVAMSRGETVEGRITSRGIGVPFALLEIRDSTGLMYATSLSDSDGYFSVRMEAF